MSDALFPTLPGLAWSTFKRPVFNSRVQTSVNLSELRASFSATPIYRFRLSYEVLVQDAVVDELRTLAGFFQARRGRFDSWRYRDPDDHRVVRQGLGVGDGTRTVWPLVRSFGESTERVAQVEAIEEVRVNDVPTTAYTLSGTGVLTFVEPPAVSAAVDWSGTYWHRCRFVNDEQEFEQFLHRLWKAQSVDFFGNLGTKL
jgi:uncharacterized protein (TIGR02217 family)